MACDARLDGGDKSELLVKTYKYTQSGKQISDLHNSVRGKGCEPTSVLPERDSAVQV